MNNEENIEIVEIDIDEVDVDAEDAGIEIDIEEELEIDDDLVEGVDEDGNSVLLRVERYFFYNGEEYVVLAEASEHSHECGCGHDHDHECGCGHDHDHEHDEDAISLYIMKVIETEEDGEEVEEFVPVNDEKLLEQLIEVVTADFEQDEEIDD